MKQIKHQISYITLGVTDLGKMETFYTGLGFEIHAQSDAKDHPYTMYRSGALILALYPKQLLLKQASLIDENSDNDADNSSDKDRASSISLNVENKQDVDALLYKVTQLDLGAKITREGFVPKWGGYCGYFKDPENNLWEIAWHEKFEFSF